MRDRISLKLNTARTLLGAGVVRPTRPDRLLRSGAAFVRWGPTTAAGTTVNAVRHSGETALADDLGTLTFAGVHRRTNALAHALAARGVVEGDGVAIMCRNHRGFVEATIACSKLGANALFLNTGFAPPQAREVCDREGAAAVVYDAEFADIVTLALEGRRRFLAWTDGADERGPGPEPGAPTTLEGLIRSGDPSDVAPPQRHGRTVILTSGTTGLPKGANRSPESLDPAAALLSVIPLRARETTMIAAPLFHAWGFAHWAIGHVLSSAIVLRRRFDPERTLAAVAESRATALVVVPVMLQRILELPDEVLDRHDVSCLRIIAASGSALPGPLATRVMDRFGDVLYNLYGSTEVAWATIATPADLRAAPGTAGRPPRGTIVRLFDEAGRPVRHGATGRVFVGNGMLFEGYTGGGGKQVIDGLMSTGDVGHFDGGGRLFIDGRDDEMIVSGGENVFPAEVESLLAAHEAIAEAAVVGVWDEAFGQRLKACVVLREGRELDADGVRAHVKANLARYKVPRDVEFVAELPRNATGKVLKRELR